MPIKSYITKGSDRLLHISMLVRWQWNQARYCTKGGRENNIFFVSLARQDRAESALDCRPAPGQMARGRTLLGCKQAQHWMRRPLTTSQHLVTSISLDRTWSPNNRRLTNREPWEERNRPIRQTIGVNVLAQMYFRSHDSEVGIDLMS